MASIQWGSWTSGYSNNFRVGIRPSQSSDNYGGTVYVQDQYHNTSDTQTLTLTGDWGGSKSYHHGGGTVTVYTGSRDGEPGKTYSIGAKVSGIYNGASPSVSGVKISVPAVAPSVPRNVHVDNVGLTKCSVKWSAPSSNGGSALSRYQVQVAQDSAFKDIVDSEYSGLDNIQAMEGLNPNDGFYARVRAQNKAGKWSGWTKTGEFSTPVDKPSGATGLKVTRSSDSRQNLSWNPRDSDDHRIAHQYVERREYNQGWGSFHTIATLSGSTSSYADTSTAANWAYTYRIRSVNAAGTTYSSASPTVFTTPAKPNITSVSHSNTSNKINWSSSVRVTGLVYDLEYSVDGGAWKSLKTADDKDRSYTHSGLPAGVSYQYRIRSRVSTSGSSDVGRTLTSGWDVSSVIKTIPTKPLNVRFTDRMPVSLDVAWDAPSSNGGSSVTSYKVQWSTSSSFSGASTKTVSGRSTTLTGLSPNKTYYVRVLAVNAQGNSAYSSTASGKTLPGVWIGNGSEWRPALLWVGNGSSWDASIAHAGKGGSW